MSWARRIAAMIADSSFPGASRRAMATAGKQQTTKTMTRIPGASTRSLIASTSRVAEPVKPGETLRVRI